MKFYKTLGLATAGVAWLATSSIAQRINTNPTAVPNTVSTPTFSPDTLRPSRDKILNDETAGQDDADRKKRRDRKRTMRRNNRSDGNSRMTRNSNTSTVSNVPSSPNSSRQNDAYRQGSASSGTINNNSNTTNANSSNVMTAPTGVGSNPGATGAAGDVRPGTTATGNTLPTSTAGNPSGAAATPNLNRSAATGTGDAVSGASDAPITNPSFRTRSTTLADFVASQPDYSTLQNALQSADLVNTLKEGQAYTLFAPSNAAFKRLPAATQNVLLEGQNKESLKKLLTYHVVQGTVDARELTKQINAGKGKAQLKTLNGGLLTAKVGADNRVMITDEQGNSAYVDTPDQIQTNGVIHGIDNVLMPKVNSLVFK
ncbi:MAG: fasciclin domain-containing protein [Rudanella sp.]|nr:fasciclin domain-containing protein [Rudanella sp.]